MRQLIAVLALLSVPRPALVHAQDTVAASMAGSWIHCGAEAELSRRDTRIEQVVGRMSPLLQPLARQAIRERLPVEAHLDLAVTNDGVRFGLSAWTVEVPMDTPATTVAGPRGAPTRIRAFAEDRRLVLVQDSSEGRRENHFSLSEDGSYLFLQVRVTSPQLPAPIFYTLTFRRV